MPARSTSDLDAAALARLLRVQDGVVARAQLVRVGATRADVRRLLARRELVEVHPRTYLSHTGRASRRQLEWAAVLACWPAALHRESALDAHRMVRDRSPSSDPQPIHVLVELDRRITAPVGVVVERVTDHARWVQQQRRPPRAVLEFALLKAASARDEAGAIALVSDAVQQGLTTAERLGATLTELSRLPRRALLAEVLGDVASGARSVLEQRYLREVERAHGLPTGERQVREDTRSGTVHRDVCHDAQRTIIELDGAFGHRDAVDRWSDLQRDLDASLEDRLTLRAGWAQVLEPCRLAHVVGRVLRRRGWAGPVRPCGPGCVAPGSGALDAGAHDPTYRPHAPPSNPG